MDSRCARCAGGTRSVPKSTAYRDPDYVRLRRCLLATHRATFGPRCPRCLKPEDGTVKRRLTLNHTTTLSAPGSDILGPVEVMCTSCNSKQLHIDRPDVASCADDDALDGGWVQDGPVAGHSNTFFDVLRSVTYCCSVRTISRETYLMSVFLYVDFCPI